MTFLPFLPQQVRRAVRAVVDSLNGLVKEQALRYAVILLDIADESKEDFDELIIEVRASTIWVHFAVRPKGNRRNIVFDIK